MMSTRVKDALKAVADLATHSADELEALGKEIARPLLEGACCADDAPTYCAACTCRRDASILVLSLGLAAREGEIAAARGGLQ